jgi:hypothetical protein
LISKEHAECVLMSILPLRSNGGDELLRTAAQHIVMLAFKTWELPGYLFWPCRDTRHWNYLYRCNIAYLFEPSMKIGHLPLCIDIQCLDRFACTSNARSPRCVAAGGIGCDKNSFVLDNQPWCKVTHQATLDHAVLQHEQISTQSSQGYRGLHQKAANAPFTWHFCRIVTGLGQVDDRTLPNVRD